jgi:hypothetical protein
LAGPSKDEGETTTKVRLPVPDNARYFVGRVLKSGQLDIAKVVEAISNPVEIRRRAYLYTFTNHVNTISGNGSGFLFGHLTKYSPLGEVGVVDNTQHISAVEGVSNLIQAESPFVYIPQFQVIAYQHVWNKLEHEQFRSLFKELIEEKFEGFFVEVEIEPIADLRGFFSKVIALETVEAISAKIHPSNPLFGPAWEELDSYLGRRNAGLLRITEEAKDADGLSERIKATIRVILDSPHAPAQAIRDAVSSGGASLTDAAVLMATDGYGRAKITGNAGGRTVVVNTSETQVSFQYPKEPNPAGLYDETLGIVDRMNLERRLEHPE